MTGERTILDARVLKFAVSEAIEKCWNVLLIYKKVGQGPIALACVSLSCLDIFSRLSFLFFLPLGDVPI